MQAWGGSQQVQEPCGGRRLARDLEMGGPTWGVKGRVTERGRGTWALPAAPVGLVRGSGFSCEADGKSPECSGGLQTPGSQRPWPRLPQPAPCRAKQVLQRSKGAWGPSRGGPGVRTHPVWAHRDVLAFFKQIQKAELMGCLTKRS